MTFSRLLGPDPVESGSLHEELIIAAITDQLLGLLHLVLGLDLSHPAGSAQADLGQSRWSPGSLDLDLGMFQIL